MKIKYIYIILLCLLNSLSYSQIIKSVGLKGGITISSHNWENSIMDYYYTFKTSPSIYSVITADFIMKEYWDVSADLGFYKSSNQTSKNPFNYNTIVFPPNMLLSFGFFTFSPYFRLKIPVKAFTPYIFIGPRIDYYNSKLSSDDANNYKDVITNKPMYGFNIGEGISYKINNLTIFAEYQFLYSFNYLINQPNPDTLVSIYSQYYDISRIKTKTTTHVITLGLKYYFK